MKLIVDLVLFLNNFILGIVFESLHHVYKFVALHLQMMNLLNWFLGRFNTWLVIRGYLLLRLPFWCLIQLLISSKNKIIIGFPILVYSLLKFINIVCIKYSLLIKTSPYLIVCLIQEIQNLEGINFHLRVKFLNFVHF